MDVTSTTTATASQPTSTASAAKAATGFAASLNADTFLKLLVAQLKNQDPTKPMDSTEYVSQIATLSQVEQGAKTNQKLDAQARRQQRLAEYAKFAADRSSGDAR